MFIYGSDGMAGQARLQTNPGSGRAVSFENGGDQVSFAAALVIKPYTAGGPVRMCLVAIPSNSRR
ncbi:MAG: hypothetical protein WBV25_14090 [Methylocella sp.]